MADREGDADEGASGAGEDPSDGGSREPGGGPGDHPGLPCVHQRVTLAIFFVIVGDLRAVIDRYGSERVFGLCTTLNRFPGLGTLHAPRTLVFRSRTAWLLPF